MPDLPNQDSKDSLLKPDRPDPAESQQFLETQLESGASADCELADFEGLVSQSFEIQGPDGAELPQLVLKKVELLPPIETDRKTIRKAPFTLLFEGAASSLVAGGIYRVTPAGVDSEATSPFFLLYLDLYDVWPEEDRAFYESVFN